MPLIKTKTSNFDTLQDSSHIEIFSLHPAEVQLLKSLRNNWRYGEIVIIMRDGLPMRLKRVTEFLDLNS